MSTSTTSDRRLAFWRGLHQCCPHCGQRTLFEPGHRFRVARTCRQCDLPLDRGGGFFLGPVCINYGIVAFGIVSPIILLGIVGAMPWTVAVTLSVIGAIVLPILLYRFSWGAWIGGFYASFPELLTLPGRILHDDAEF